MVSSTQRYEGECLDLRNPVPHIGRTLHTLKNPLTPVLTREMVQKHARGRLEKISILHDFFKSFQSGNP